jgi:hypothetical protein
VGNTWWPLFAGEEIGEGLGTSRRASAAAAVAEFGTDLGSGGHDLDRGKSTVRARRQRRQERTDERNARRETGHIPGSKNAGRDNSTPHRN